MRRELARLPIDQRRLMEARFGARLSLGEAAGAIGERVEGARLLQLRALRAIAASLPPGDRAP